MVKTGVPVMTRSPDTGIGARVHVARFAGCTEGGHQIDHRMPGIVPSGWCLAEG